METDSRPAGVTRLGEVVLRMLEHGPATDGQLIARIRDLDGWTPPMKTMLDVTRQLDQLDLISGYRGKGQRYTNWSLSASSGRLSEDRPGAVD